MANSAVAQQWWMVTLLPEEVEWINKNAAKRNSFGKRQDWSSKTKNTSDIWNITGLAGELAVSLVYNRRVRQITDRRVSKLRESDLEGGIDVKTRQSAAPGKSDMMVNEDQLKDDRLYVLALSEWFPRQVAVAGWVNGHEVRGLSEMRVHAANGHRIFVYPLKRLKDPKTLFDELNRRETDARIRARSLQ